VRPIVGHIPTRLLVGLYYGKRSNPRNANVNALVMVVRSMEDTPVCCYVVCMVTGWLVVVSLKRGLGKSSHFHLDRLPEYCGGLWGTKQPNKDRETSYYPE
jgi:hypothetical protein